MKRVFLKAKVKDIPRNLTPDGYFILKLTQHNIHKWPGLIQKCIDKFNSVHKWDEMWNEMDAEARFELGHTMWVYLKLGEFDNPIGYIWIDGSDFYNAFMHPSREKGHSVLFYQEVIHDLDHKIEEVDMWTDDWNIAAQKWALKTGFKIV